MKAIDGKSGKIGGLMATTHLDRHNEKMSKGGSRDLRVPGLVLREVRTAPNKSYTIAYAGACRTVKPE